MNGLRRYATAPDVVDQGRGPATSFSEVREVFHRLLEAYGPQHWWPGETPFEVMVGAVLTQCASWNNVEKAIANLKCRRLLEPAALRQVPLEALAQVVRPSGYFNAKARKLKSIAEWLGTKGDDIAGLSGTDAPRLREELLALYGVGNETADSIMLYAFGIPVFVVDAYTTRIFGRLGIGPGARSYGSWQAFFSGNLPKEARLFNEYHALIVCHGKTACRKVPLCEKCCLQGRCPAGGHAGPPRA